MGALLLLLVGSIQPAPQAEVPAWEGPWLVAHRGMDGAPENTLPALRRAASWADAAEVDVSLTADGVPVLLHDLWLERTTDGSGLVHEADWSDVSRLRSEGVPVPRLGDALREAERLGLPLWLDPKGLPEHRERVVEAVAAEVRAAGAQDRVWLLAAPCPEELRCLAPGPHGVGPGVEGVLLHASELDADVVEAARSAGLRVAVWGATGPVRWPVDAWVVDGQAAADASGWR